MSDIAAEIAFKKLKLKYKKYSFLERGSDERQFNSPGVDLNFGSIMRSKYATYKEYHTSLDNFNFVNVKGLLGGFNIAKESIKILIKLKIKKNKLHKIVKKGNPISRFKCEPFLKKRNLYPSISSKVNYGNFSDKLLNFLQYADGKNSFNDISKLIKVKKKECMKVFKILKKNSLLKFS